MWDSQDSDPQIVLRKWYVLLIGWIMLLAAPLLLSILLIKIATGEDEIGAAALIALVPVLGAVGIWMAGGTTTVTFHRYTESMTVTRGYGPLFLWWLRTKCISRETARTAHVTFRGGGEDTADDYRVEVETPSGKPLILFRDVTPGAVNDLEIRIRQWSGLEC
jgi:hypothetical protein